MKSAFHKGWILTLAHGFGAGKVPWAPGTFGSIPGLLLLWLFIQSGNWPALLALISLTIPLSVWICGEAEKLLGQKDPGSIVFDEMIAIPVSFLGWIILFWKTHQHFPVIAEFFKNGNWKWTFAILLAFRFFDILKPWPIGASQRLPGGWGVTIDDTLAAICVAGLTLVAGWLTGG